MFAALVTDGHKTASWRRLLQLISKLTFWSQGLEVGEKTNSAVGRFFYSGSYVHETLSFSSKNLWNKNSEFLY